MTIPAVIGKIRDMTGLLAFDHPGVARNSIGTKCP